MTSESSNLVQPTHLARRAYVYVRQSSPRQVTENTESARRQYALRDRALALGWAAAHIDVIDCDQGVSGTRVADRPGFQRLMSEVTMGRAGLVLGLEVSRLARNCSDWHRLVEVCAMTGTLILDQDGLYDPTSFNHQLVLGIKGLLSAVEVGILRARMRNALLAKASRGELRTGLPVGFVHDEHGKVRLHPDSQVQHSVRLLFETFRRCGAAGATVKYFRDGSLLFPRPAVRGSNSAEVVWKPLDLQTVVRVLHSPVYAGAFAYGRRRTERLSAGGHRTRKLPQEQWHALVRDAHEGYIGWDEFERNEQQLGRSALAYGLENRATPPREGPALLQGLVLCGVCGARMTVRYHDRAAGLMPDYQCISGRMHGRRPVCQVIPGGSIDRAVGRRLVETMTPMAIELTLAVRAELQGRLDEADRLRQMQVERARYEADSARRRYMLVDADNRLVAETLEREWNDKLRALARVRDEAERHGETDRATLDKATEERIGALAEDFRVVFDDPATSHRDRKRMAQLLIEDVTLLRSDRLHVHIRFKGGATESLALPLPETAWRQRLTRPEVVALIDRLLEQYDDNHQVAERLNAQGVLTGAHNPFDAAAVRWVRHVHGLQSHQERQRAGGKLTTREMAARLGLDVRVVRQMTRDGRVTGGRSGRKAIWLTDPIEEQPDEIRRLALRHAEQPGQGSRPHARPPATTQALRARIELLVLDGHDDATVAETLNAEGWRTACGASFGATTVRGTRERCGIKTLWAQQLDTGKLTLSRMGGLLGVGITTVNNWADAGKLHGTRCGNRPKARWALDPLEEQPEPIRQLAARRATLPRHHGVLSDAAAARGVV